MISTIFMISASLKVAVIIEIEQIFTIHNTLSTRSYIIEKKFAKCDTLASQFASISKDLPSFSFYISFRSTFMRI